MAPPEARSDLETVTVDDVDFVFDRPARRLHRLNPTAGLVLSSLDGRRSVEQLVSELAESFGADRAQVDEQVRQAIEQFREQGLLLGSAPSVSPLVDPAPDVAPGPWAERFGVLFGSHPATVDLGRFRAIDHEFTVQVDDAVLGAYLAEILGSLRVPPRSSTTQPTSYRCRSPKGRGGQWRFYRNGVRLTDKPSAARVAEHLIWQVNRQAVASVPDSTVLHAGGVVRDGVAVLLPAESNAGKSTLVSGLLAAGFDYLSDEAVALTADDQLLPFPKALGLDRGSWPLFPDLEPPEAFADLHQNRWHVPPNRIRPDSVGRPVELGAIVVPRYREGEATRWEPLAPTDAFVLLLEQAFTVAERPDALAQVARLVLGCGARRLVSGSLEGSVAAVCDLVAERAAR